MIALRAARDGDSAVLAEVFCEARRVGMPYLPEPLPSAREIDRWLTKSVLPSAVVTVAERDGAILGYTVLDGDHLDQLYIRPDAWSLGVGSALLQDAQRRHPDGVSLFVFQANTRARTLYERHGFRVEALNDGSGNMEGLPDALYVWGEPLP